MSEMSDELLEGACCSHCGIYFDDIHGYPVLCHSCYDSETKAERAGLQRATEKELE